MCAAAIYELVTIVPRNQTSPTAARLAACFLLRAVTLSVKFVKQFHDVRNGGTRGLEPYPVCTSGIQETLATGASYFLGLLK